MADVILSDQHPAPLPHVPDVEVSIYLGGIPPEPHLKVRNGEQGMILSWDMPLFSSVGWRYAPLTMFEVYMYREQNNVPISSLLWKKMFDVKFQAMSMSCTINGIEGQMYHFSMRAVDMLNHRSPFSHPMSIVCRKKIQHPVPLPPNPVRVSNPDLPAEPPKLDLKISNGQIGIILKWNMLPSFSPRDYAEVDRYEVFGYQEGKKIRNNSSLWSFLRDVIPLELPMANTITPVKPGFKYHYAVRAVDVHNQIGVFSDPVSIIFKPIKLE